MAEQSSKVYQSGQPVPVTGVYEVAGAQTKSPKEGEESPVRELKEGELFPNFEGRAVAWHPKRATDERSKTKA